MKISELAIANSEIMKIITFVMLSAFVFIMIYDI